MPETASRTRRILNGLGFTLLLGLLAAGVWFASHEAAAAGDSFWKSNGGRWLLRGGLVAVALAAWFWSQALIGGRGFPQDRIGDLVHDLTASWNRHLNGHPRRADALLMSSSLLLDLLGLFLLGAAIFGSTLRPFVGLLILFIFRQLCQACCSLPAPQGLIWRNPGFPSLLVTYGVANDLFISGHTGMAVLGAIEVGRICPLWLGIAAAIIALYEIGVVLVLRAHYTMDVLAAIAAAWCAADLAARLCAALHL